MSWRCALRRARQAIAAGTLVLGFGAVACSNPRAPAIEVEGRRSQRELQLLDLAAAKWSELDSEPITLDGGSWRLLRKDPPPGYFGYTVAKSGTIQIKSGLSDEEFYSTALHEFGHVLGLRHQMDEGIMDPHASAVEFSHCDKVECGRAGACPAIPADPYECLPGPP